MAATVEYVKMQTNRILLVDDNKTNRVVGELLLKKLGFAIDLAANGREALEAFASHSYEFILMDVQMPELDGLEATALIREKERMLCSRVPIIAMTAGAEEADRDRCIKAGMDDLLAKPIRREALIKVLEVRSISVPTEFTKPEESVPADRHKAVFNEEDLLETIGGNSELLGTLLEYFVGDLPVQMGLLEEAIGRKDKETAVQKAHRIRGGAVNMRAAALGQVFSRIEEAVRQDDFEEGANALKEAKKHFETFREVSARNRQ